MGKLWSGKVPRRGGADQGRTKVGGPLEEIWLCQGIGGHRTHFLASQGEAGCGGRRRPGFGGGQVTPVGMGGGAGRIEETLTQHNEGEGGMSFPVR